MSKFIPKIEWEKYQAILEDFMDLDIGLQPFSWLRYVDIPLPHGEDSGELYVSVGLKGLFQYNYIRVWPYNVDTVSGTIDATSITLFITKKQLRVNGYMNPDDYWDFNNVSDRFIVNGKVYRPSGDTQVAQASENPLLIFLILDMVSPEESEKILKKHGKRAK